MPLCQGQSRKDRDNRGEKGDSRRKPNPNKRKGNKKQIDLVNIGIVIGASAVVAILVVDDGTGIGILDDAAIVALLPIIEKNLQPLFS